MTKAHKAEIINLASAWLDHRVAKIEEELGSSKSRSPRPIDGSKRWTSSGTTRPIREPRRILVRLVSRRAEPDHLAVRLKGHSCRTSRVAF